MNGCEHAPPSPYASCRKGGDYDIPLSDQAVVDKEAEEWAVLWEEANDYVHPEFGEHDQQATDLLPAAIRAAALSFAIHTGLGADNLAPRAIARLSENAIQALVLLFLAFEKLGEWCAILDLVLIVLLPKGDGGRRPIGLFPTLIRVWMRARVSQARAWEAANHSREIYGGAGMGA